MGLVDMHSSWLVINSIIGCTNACKYCLLQDNGNNLCAPKVLGTPKETIEELLNFKFYDSHIPLCLFPNTDIFLNESNINYLLKTIEEIEKNNITNDLVLITKCFIPKYILEKLKKLQENGRNIVVYLSYSGLDKKMEPNVNHEDIRTNFKNLKEYGIPIVHYYRPFIPDNSNPLKIKETLDFVNQYTTNSVITGVMYVPTMMDKNKEWDYLNVVSKGELMRATSIWTEEAWNYFYGSYKHEQSFFGTNTCAFNTTLNKASHYYGTEECLNYNHCPLEQRKKCEKYFKKINEEEIINQLDKLLENLEINAEYSYKFIENSLQISEIPLDVKTLSYLSYMLEIKVCSTNGKALNDLYNSSLNGAEPLIIRKSLNRSLK